MRALVTMTSTGLVIAFVQTAQTATGPGVRGMALHDVFKERAEAA